MTDTNEDNTKKSRRLRSQPTNSTSNESSNGEDGPIKSDTNSLYDFDPHLRKSIPDALSMSVINGNIEEEEQQLLNVGYKLHLNSELLEDSFQTKLKNYELNLSNAKANKRSFRNGVVSSKTFKNYKKVKFDPLNDAIFNSFHKKGEKKEKKFITQDKEKLMIEFDNTINCLSNFGRSIKKKSSIKNQLNGLQKYTHSTSTNDDCDTDSQSNSELLNHELLIIKNNLINTTKIKDFNDMIELKIKYMLTIKELNSFLINFENLKNVEVRLKKQIDDVNKHIITNDDDASDVDDLKNYTQDFQKLKRKRMLKRRQRAGPVVKVKFYDGVMITIDPVSKPTIKRL